MRLSAALLAAAVLGLFHLANLAAAGYAAFAARHLDRPHSPATREAARIATRAAPWSATHAALEGWVLAENGAPEALATYPRALRLAPADPLLWAEYALVLARLGQFGPELTLAVAQARQRAPTSAAVRRSVAELGLSYWRRGTREQRAAWLEAMREELARSRGAFLTHVLTRGQGRTFCDDPARALGEEPWCRAIAGAIRDGCYELKAGVPAPCLPAP